MDEGQVYVIATKQLVIKYEASYKWGENIEKRWRTINS